ncbi:MAG: hypothetical protein OIF48_10220 [Silicimonas sp.]|nr:hypothetical protein [Silicimonas sp.]
MEAQWTAPAGFAPALLGAPFIAMQPAAPEGTSYSRFDLSGGAVHLSNLMAALAGGADPGDSLADMLRDLGDTIGLIPGALPPGEADKAVGPLFAPGDFDESTSGREAMRDALAQALTPHPARIALGCIDSSIAFVNTRFRRADPGGGPDRTRFEMLWIQGRSMEAPPAYGSLLRAGTLLLRADIDALIAAHWANGALDEAAVYDQFSRPPGGETDLWSLRGGHGTVVLDLMGGCPRDAEDDVALYGVELPVGVVRDTSGAVFHGPLTYGAAVIAAASYVLTPTAGGAPAPLVSNASMGFLGGPQDGTHPTAAALAAITALGEGPAGAARASDLNLPAGNHLQDRVAARLEGASATPLRWSLPPEDRTASFLEIWNEDPTQPPGVSALTLTPPGSSGGALTPLPASGEISELTLGGGEVARLYNLGTHLVLAVYPTCDFSSDTPQAPSGLWDLTLTSDAPLRLWIARDDTLAGLTSAGRQSWLRDPAYQARDGAGDYLVESAMSADGLRRDGTLSVLATAPAPVRVVPGREARGSKAYRFAGLAVGAAAPPGPGPFTPAAEVTRALGGPMGATRMGRGAMRLAGSSMASAIEARHIAETHLGLTPSDPQGYREPEAYRF